MIANTKSIPLQVGATAVDALFALPVLAVCRFPPCCVEEAARTALQFSHRCALSKGSIRRCTKRQVDQPLLMACAPTRHQSRTLQPAADARCTAAQPSLPRYLQLNSDFNQPLEGRQHTNSVTVVQFGRDFRQPLYVGYLPATLNSLVFERRWGHRGGYNQPLAAGVLPAGLLRLHVGDCFNQRL